jgi:hypothetical protein
MVVGITKENDMWQKLKQQFIFVDWYMQFHWLVLIALWVGCVYQLWEQEFGNVLAMSAMIAVWKMKGVEQ